MKKLNNGIICIRDNQEHTAIQDNLNLLNQQGIIDKCTINPNTRLSLRLFDPNFFSSFEKVWAIFLPKINAPFLLGFKTIPGMTNFDNNRYNRECSSIFRDEMSDYDDKERGRKTKFEFNPYFTKLITDDLPLLCGKSNSLLVGSGFITIDISDASNMHSVMISNDINVHKFIKSYSSKKIDFDLDLKEMRKNHIDKVTFYKVNEYYLLVGHSKKAKPIKRIFDYNIGFIKYVTSMPDFNYHKLEQKSNSDIKLDIQSNKNEIFNENDITIIEDIKSSLGSLLKDDFDGSDDLIRNLQMKSNKASFSLNNILDKISSKGIESLSFEERKYLYK